MSRYYTEDHEWIEIDNNLVTIGITSHAADELGEIVFTYNVLICVCVY